MFLRHAELQLLDLLVLELDDAAAAGADEVVVVVPVGGGFVAGLAVAELSRRGQAALGEHFMVR